MDTLHLVEVVGVLGAWGVLALAIRRWGPGRAKRSVRCPTKQVAAKVVVEQEEGDFGSLRVADVTACSLFPETLLTCDKECLARL